MLLPLLKAKVVGKEIQQPAIPAEYYGIVEVRL
ncbi:MAG: hypothetical protein ACI9JR_002534 [Gammaproteobacteria bacterium]|jgi:hypothetical protein